MKKGIIYSGTLEELVASVANHLMEIDRKREEFINKIKEFKNQLQQKGIQGALLDEAVADFVKFLKKQNKKSGVNAPCSEPSVLQNNVADKEDDNG